MCGCYDQDVPPDTGLRMVRCCGWLGMATGRPSPSGDYVCMCNSNDSCSDAARTCVPRPDASHVDAAIDAGTDARDAFTDDVR